MGRIDRSVRPAHGVRRSDRVMLLSLAPPAVADGGAPPPCRTPIAVALAVRPGTGRTTSTGHVRLALDLDDELNLASRTGSSNAVGFGLVSIVTPGRHRSCHVPAGSLVPTI